MHTEKSSLSDTSSSKDSKSHSPPSPMAATGTHTCKIFLYIVYCFVFKSYLSILENGYKANNYYKTMSTLFGHCCSWYSLLLYLLAYYAEFTLRGLINQSIINQTTTNIKERLTQDSWVIQYYEAEFYILLQLHQKISTLTKHNMLSDAFMLCYVSS